MSSEVEIRNTDFMESQSANESLRTRIREIEDENQELRTQNLLQNRTIIEQRNELMLLRIQISEMAETRELLRERVRILVENAQQSHQEESEMSIGPVTVPPLMAPPPVPPPLPSARIRISPRQVGAGEAVTTPLGISITSPPRHRIKRDCRQGFYRSARNPYRRLDNSEPGPSTRPSIFSSERPNYFVGLKIIPQFQSFICSSNQLSKYNDSASDSSGSDENSPLIKRAKERPSNLESTSRKPASLSKDFEILKNVRNLNHQKVRQSVLQNYNLSLPNTNGRFFPLSWERRSTENLTVPSTSGNEVRYFNGSIPGTSERTQGGTSAFRNFTKISDCVQYTFPTIHEGLHHSGNSVVVNGPQPSRLRKYKKNILYLFGGSEDVKQENGEETALRDEGKRKSREAICGIDSESLSSFDDLRTSRAYRPNEMLSDFEQDGFQADESSNCLTSTDNSLERISMSESNTDKKN